MAEKLFLPKKMYPRGVSKGFSMPEITNNIKGQSAQELIVIRVFEAPQQLVFDAWTKPRHALNWYGPTGFTVPVCEMDVRTGGAFLFCLRSPSGAHCWERGVFIEVVAPSRLVSVYTASLNDGPGVELKTEVTFEDVGNKTRVTVCQTFFDSNFTRGAHEGVTEGLERLAAYVADLHLPNNNWQPESTR
jgi:uncharacterized protein YndB with AHSA1/START domain